MGKCPSAWQSVKFATAASLITASLSKRDVVMQHQLQVHGTLVAMCLITALLSSVTCHSSQFEICCCGCFICHGQWNWEWWIAPWWSGTPQGQEKPEQRESDLFSTTLVDNCQFRSLMLVFTDGHLTETLPWLHAIWITPSWSYPVVVDTNILTNAGFSWGKKAHFIRTGNSVQKNQPHAVQLLVIFLLFTLNSKKRRLEAWAKQLISTPVLISTGIENHVAAASVMFKISAT